MMVMMIAMMIASTPSLKASIRVFHIDEFLHVLVCLNCIVTRTFISEGWVLA
jgi:hypothetical protein